MNYYDARELRDEKGKPSGIWHYTVENSNHIYAVGYCAKDCAGHATPEEAREHYRLYLLDSARYDGVSQDEQRKCEVCGQWTQSYAHIPMAMSRHFLCSQHLNKTTLDTLVPSVAQAISS